MAFAMVMATHTVLLHLSPRIAPSKIARIIVLSMAIAPWSILSVDASATL